MIQVDIDRWRKDPYVVERIYAAARRERAEMVHHLLVRFGARLRRVWHRVRAAPGPECTA